MHHCRVGAKGSLGCINLLRKSSIVSEASDKVRTQFCTSRSPSGPEIQRAACQNLIRPGTKTDWKKKKTRLLLRFVYGQLSCHRVRRRVKRTRTATEQVHLWCKSNVMCCNKIMRWLKKEAESIRADYSWCNSEEGWKGSGGSRKVRSRSNPCLEDIVADRYNTVGIIWS